MTNPVDISAYTRRRAETHKSTPGLRVLLEGIERLRQLHAPVKVCRGCCSTLCCGDCHWSDEYDGELLSVCSHCCIDRDEQKQNFSCLDYHEHGAEYGLQQPICETSAILATMTTEK